MRFFSEKKNKIKLQEIVFHEVKEKEKLIGKYIEKLKLFSIFLAV